MTSGTTGGFKLVLMNPPQTYGGQEMAHFRTLDSVAQPADPSLCINYLNLGIWTAGGYGGPIIAWDRGGTAVFHQGPAAERSLAVPGVNFALVTPAYLTQLLAAPQSVLPRNDNLTLAIAGGALSMPLANRVKARLTNRIVTTLGATETGGWAMTPVETEEDLRWHRLMPHRVVEVVDEDDRPLAPGQLGQVRVLIDNGVSGYMNDAEATARFFRDGWFYSGDLGVLDGNGRLALSGRITDILNVLGDKIPSGPLEEAFQALLDLDGVCLLTQTNADGGEGLHIVLETSAPIGEGRLREAATKALHGFPEIAIHYHFTPTFPRNAMGKVQRFRLLQQLKARQLATV
jgi:acyl-coenzyme A synthetase/AMP-(fatty) acid ligase